MRTIGAFLQDHGVNLAFNSHEHNYQRTHPLRALPHVIDAPIPGVPQVEIDSAFDGASHTVADGVPYFVEGAGGNRDFDNNLPTEPLTLTSSATPSQPAPFGTDYRGRPLNDPVPDTVFDPVARRVVSSAGVGTPALLDKVMVTKPNLSDETTAKLKVREHVEPGESIQLRSVSTTAAGSR